jgi:MSHA biogenesis protein MshP
MTARRERGFAYIAAVVFLVVLAGFALAVLRLSDTEQATVNQQLMGARANQAARMGLEWAFYRLRGANVNCGALTSAAPPDFLATTGFVVSVNCGAQTYSEGQAPDGSALMKTIFQLTATACNGTATVCPSTSDTDVANPDYVERRRSASICITAAGNDCY